MTLTVHAFIRRFLLHVLPDGFHLIRHYGLLASSRRADTLARIRQIMAAATPAAAPQECDAGGRAETEEPTSDNRPPCPCCGGRMILVERFPPGHSAAPHRRRQDRHLMRLVPGSHPEKPRPVSARERVIMFGPMVETALAAIADSAQTQQTPGFRASRTEHSAPDPRLARSRRPRRAAKSP